MVGDGWERKVRGEVSSHSRFQKSAPMLLLKAQFDEASRVNELTSQLTQQTEYCASMGAACATLLWRVSRRDDAVESLLSGVSLSVDDYTEQRLLT